MTLFEFIDYRKYLTKYIASLPKQGRGFRTKIAEALNVKPSYISMIFSGELELSVEQAIALKLIMAWSDQECTYFLNLVHKARAGTRPLKEYYEKEIKRLQTEALRLKNQIVTDQINSKENEFQYFSSAEYAYVHILITIPEYQTKQALLHKLNLSPNRLEKILNFLIEIGLVKQEGDRFVVGPRVFHIPDDAAIIASHHTNWRVQAIKACQSATPEDLHYSSVVSISQEDFLKIKSSILKELKNWRKIINDSPCEKPFSLCFDFYELK